MSHNSDPREAVIAHLVATRSLALRHFGADGHYCEVERSILDAIDHAANEIRFDKEIDDAAAYLRRSRGKVSAYGKRLFERVGLEIDTVYVPPQIVPFPRRDDASAG